MSQPEETPAVEEAPAAVDGEGAVPEAPPAPDMDAVNSEWEAKLSRALGGAQKSDRRAIEAEQRIKELEEKYAGADDRLGALDGYKADPSKLWADGHLTREALEDLNKRYIDGTLSAPSAADLTAAEARKEAQAVRDEVKELKEARAAEQASAAFQSDLTAVRNVVTAEGSEYELVAAFDRTEQVTKQIHEQHRKTGQVDGHAVLKAAEEALQADIIRAMNSDAGLRVALADEAVKAKILAALAPPGEGEETATETTEHAQQDQTTGATTAARGGPSTLTQSQVAQAATRRRPDAVTSEQARQNAIAALKQFNVDARKGAA